MNSCAGSAIVIGSGFAGAVIARQLAEKNVRVDLIEERNSVGGNMAECEMAGVLVHKYGPHIFHTKDKKVFEYLSRFSDFTPYRHKVVGVIDNKLVPIPINFRALDILFGKESSGQIKNRMIRAFGPDSRVSVYDLMYSEDFKWLGDFIYEKVYKYYSQKQWGMHADRLNENVIKRVPVVVGYRDEYFDDEYQFMPTNGYNSLFFNMLTHKNITIELKTKAEDVLSLGENGRIYYKNNIFNGNVFFTGMIDRLFNYRYGALNYRTADFIFESYDVPYFQLSAVVNYPCSEKFTRISEFKYLTGQVCDNTCILKEFPREYQSGSDIPLYPVNNAEQELIYAEYLKSASRYPQLYLSGRLAEYKYYNMDQAVRRSLELANSLY